MRIETAGPNRKSTSPLVTRFTRVRIETSATFLLCCDRNVTRFTRVRIETICGQRRRPLMTCHPLHAGADRNDAGPSATGASPHVTRFTRVRIETSYQSRVTPTRAVTRFTRVRIETPRLGPPADGGVCHPLHAGADRNRCVQLRPLRECSVTRFTRVRIETCSQLSRKALMMRHPLHAGADRNCSEP